MDLDLDLLLKKTSRSLYLSARILPETLRPAFAIAYLLCRYADTIADTPLLPPEKRLFWITQFPELVRRKSAAVPKILTKRNSLKICRFV